MDDACLEPAGRAAMRYPRTTITVTVAALLGAAACSSDSTGVAGSSQGTIAFTTGTSSAGNIAAAAAPVTVGSHTLDLTSVSLTISRAELKRSHSDNCPGDEDGDDDHPQNASSTESCGELKIGLTTIELPLTGGLVTIPANAIPAGTFREFELRVSQVEMKGTFDGKPFDVTVPVRAKSEVEFNTPLVVTADTPTAVTVNVPVSTWLTANDGSLIDPSTIATNSSVAAQVKGRIAASFRAFEDRDHDGHEDHGRN